MAKDQAYYDQISHALHKKMIEEREMKWSVSNLKYQEELIKEEVKLKVQKLNKHMLFLDKLSFANNAYRNNPKTASCLSFGELDGQKLQFLMQHGSKNMANEKKLLREINSSQKRRIIGTTTIDELDDPIKKMNEEIKNSHLYLHRTDFEGIHKEIKRYEMVREKAVSNAAVGGRLWSSLGTKKKIQQKVNVMYEELDELRLKQVETRNEAKYGERKLGRIEKHILYLQKQLEGYK